MLQCVAVCCSVLQCVAVCCSVLQCGAVCCSVLQCVAVCYSVLQIKPKRLQMAANDGRDMGIAIFPPCVLQNTYMVCQYAELYL